MMISPQVYVDELKNEPFEKLVKERERLYKELKKIEKDAFDSERVMHGVIVNKKVPLLSEKIPHLFLSIYRREIPADKILALSIQILDSDFYSSCDTGTSSTFICSAAASFLGLPRRLVDVILSRSFMR